MSRKKVAVLCLCYFAALMAYALYSQLRQPFGSASVGNPAVIGEMIGKAVAVYLESGVIPIIIWAFFRFRAEYFAAPLVIWIILGIGCLAAIAVEEGHEQQAELDRLTSTPTLSRADHDLFIRGATQACIPAQKANELNRAGAITNEQIDRYCNCYARELVDAITIEEYAALYKTGGQRPASVDEKIVQASLKCGHTVLAK